MRRRKRRGMRRKMKETCLTDGTGRERDRALDGWPLPEED